MLIGIIDRRLLKRERRFKREFDPAAGFHFGFRSSERRSHSTTDGSRIATDCSSPTTTFSFFRNGLAPGGRTGLCLGSQVTITLEPWTIHHQADEFSGSFILSN